MRFAKPLDEELIRKLLTTHEVAVTVEEAAIGGFGAHVLTLASDEGLIDAGLKLRTMRLPDIFQDQDKPEKQYDEAGLNAAGIVETVLKALRRNSVGDRGGAGLSRAPLAALGWDRLPQLARSAHFPHRPADIRDGRMVGAAVGLSAAANRRLDPRRADWPAAVGPRKGRAFWIAIGGGLASLAWQLWQVAPYMPGMAGRAESRQGLRTRHARCGCSTPMS